MKKLMLLLSAVLFLSGCIGDDYQHKYTDKNGNEQTIRLSTVRVATNLKADNVIIALPDGAVFSAVTWNKTADPNSAIAIGSAIAECIKAYNYSSVLEGE